MLLPLLIVALFGYLLGSLPFGYLVARAKGVNIFEVGSCSPGATNVRRTLGAGPGNLVFVLDTLKGAAAAWWGLLQYTGATLTYSLEEWGLTTGATISGEQWTRLGVVGLIAALLGHSFSCFTKFRGGKGVATSVGGLVILMPLAAVFCALTWVIVFYSIRFVSLASIAAALALVASAYLLRLPSLLLGLAIIIAGIVILRHRTNIARLLNGTENRCGKKTAEPKP